jgi:hypothetical protein
LVVGFAERLVVFRSFREEFCFRALLGFCSTKISLSENKFSRSISIEQKSAGSRLPETKFFSPLSSA